VICDVSCPVHDKVRGFGSAQSGALYSRVVRNPTIGTKGNDPAECFHFPLSNPRSMKREFSDLTEKTSSPKTDHNNTLGVSEL